MLLHEAPYAAITNMNQLLHIMLTSAQQKCTPVPTHAQVCLYVSRRNVRPDPSTNTSPKRPHTAPLRQPPPFLSQVSQQQICFEQTEPSLQDFYIHKAASTQ